MNDSIAISGRAGADPTFTTNAKGTHIASFSVATDYLRRDANGQYDRENKQTNWYKVVTFGELAKGVASAVRKGRNVMVSGRLRIIDWENPDGRKGTKVEIVAESVGLDLRWAEDHLPAQRPAADQQAAVAAEPAASPEGASSVAPSADPWYAPGVSREAALADSEAPF